LERHEACGQPYGIVKRDGLPLLNQCDSPEFRAARPPPVRLEFPANPYAVSFRRKWKRGSVAGGQHFRQARPSRILARFLASAPASKRGSGWVFPGPCPAAFPPLQDTAVRDNCSVSTI